MLCQSCQTIYPFYLKYCRICGEKLNQQERPAMVKTQQLASSNICAEVGEPARQYVTAPLTKEIGGKHSSIADMVRQILDSFPSLDTVKMNCVAQDSGLLERSMRETLREFSFDELQNMERTSELLLAVQKQFAVRVKTPDTTTLELPVNRGIKRVADTVPLEPKRAELVVDTAITNKPESSRPLYISNELPRTCPQNPVKLHLRPTSRELNLPATAQFPTVKPSNSENLYDHLKTVTRRVLDVICNRIIKTLVNA